MTTTEPATLRDAEDEKDALLNFARRVIFPDAEKLRTTGDKGLVNGLVVDPDSQRIAKVFGRFDGGATTPTLTQDDSFRMTCELEDLGRLRAHGVVVPDVLYHGEGYFVLRLLPQDRVNFKALAAVLQHLHQKTANDTRPAAFGFHRDSFYGLRRICNPWSDDWWPFFVNTRLRPSLALFKKNRKDNFSTHLSSRTVALLRFGTWLADALLVNTRSDEQEEEKVYLFAAPRSGSLLHGDVFANNVLHDTTTGTTALIDPVCFYGDPIMDMVKFGNKQGDNEPRGRVYKFYYALDLYAWTGELAHLEAAEVALKKLVRVMVTRLYQAPPPMDKKKKKNCNGGAQDGAKQRLSLWDRGLRLPPSTLIMRWREIDDSNKKPAFTLVCFGAFNPPHPNHLSLLNSARTAIKEQHGLDEGTPLLECQGFFVPAPDSYLSSDSKKTHESQRLALEQRESLLLSGQKEWGVHTFCCDHGVTMDLLRLMTPGELFLVAGSDTAEKALDPSFLHIPVSTNVVLVQRSETSGETDWSSLDNLVAKRKNNGGGRVLIVRRQEAEAWSSTKIRQDPNLWSQFSQATL